MNRNRLAKGAVVAFLAAVLVLVLFNRGHNQPPSKHGNRSTTTAQPDDNTSTTSTLRAETATSPSSQPGAQSSGANAPVQQTQSLAVRAVDFLRNYYLIRPDDTEQSRRERVAPYVKPDLLPDLDVGLSSGTAADNARIRERLTQSGEVQTGNLQSAVAADDDSIRIVMVPVTVTITRPNNQQLSQYVLRVGSRVPML
jgi:hypothetical protein